MMVSGGTGRSKGMDNILGEMGINILDILRTNSKMGLGLWYIIMGSTIKESGSRV